MTRMRLPCSGTAVPDRAGATLDKIGGTTQTEREQVKQGSGY